MKVKRIRLWNMAGAAFALVTGTLLHFVYEWFGGNFWASVGAVNESTWEHLKLLFFPVLFWWIVEYLFRGRGERGFFAVRILAVLAGMLFIVAGFYTYSGILGKNYAVVDISLFVLAVLLTFYLVNRYAEGASSLPAAADGAALAVFILLAAGFVFFTFTPPHIGIFLDPVTGGYGL